MQEIPFTYFDDQLSTEFTGTARISVSEFSQECEWSPYQSLDVEITEVRDVFGNLLPLIGWTPEQMMEMENAAVDAFYRMPLLEPVEAWEEEAAYEDFRAEAYVNESKAAWAA